MPLKALTVTLERSWIGNAMEVILESIKITYSLIQNAIIVTICKNYCTKGESLKKLRSFCRIKRDCSNVICLEICYSEAATEPSILSFSKLFSHMAIETCVMSPRIDNHITIEKEIQIFEIKNTLMISSK